MCEEDCFFEGRLRVLPEECRYPCGETQLSVSVCFAQNAALPDRRGTVDHGERLYAQLCLACHGPEGANGINDQLVGHYNPDNDFAGDTSLPRTIGNYWPYATTVYDYINRSMPMAKPCTLTSDEVYGLVAYLLTLTVSSRKVR